MSKNNYSIIVENAAARSNLPMSQQYLVLSEPPRLPIVTEIDRYLIRKKAKGLSEGTLAQYRIVLEAFLRYTSAAALTDINDISDWDILSFLDNYQSTRNISNRRKENMRIILNGFFRYETDLGNLRRNPMATVDSIKFKKNIRVPLSDIEMELLREACETLRDKALVEFFFATGCRVSEVEGCNIDDIDMINRQVRVVGKGNKERTVFLNASAIVAVKKYLDSRKDNDRALFVIERRPFSRLKKISIEKRIRLLGEKAGIKRNVYPHLIRHTTATYLLNHGMLLEEVQVLLGHESVDTTRIYAKSDMGILRNNYKRAMV